MRDFIRIAVCLVVLLSGVFAHDVSHACPGTELISIETQVEEADVVFTGRALRTKPLFLNSDKAVTTFLIVRKEKGFTFRRKVKVEHYRRQSFCNFPKKFKSGKEYRVMAQKGGFGRLFIQS